MIAKKATCGSVTSRQSWRLLEEQFSLAEVTRAGSFSFCLVLRVVRQLVRWSVLEISVTGEVISAAAEVC